MPAPTISGISPATGRQGTVVTLTGTNFIGATAVTFGTTPATSFVVNSATQIAAVAPAGLGIPDITVTNLSGTSATSSADLFTYSNYVPKDVIVYLDVPPWKFLVKNHNGIVTRTPHTDYAKATNRRNQFAGDVIGIPPGINVATGNGKIAPVASLTSPLALNTDLAFILSSAAAEQAGVAGMEPKPEVFTRIERFFCTTDAPTAPTPYSCWDDTYLGLGDIDPTNELDE